MKSFIVLALCVAVAVALPLDSSKDAKTEILLFDNIGVDGYNYEVRTSDGKSAQESGQLKNIGTENEAISVVGSYSYVDPVDGRTYTVNYVADENGFQPQGEHIPKAQ